MSEPTTQQEREAVHLVLACANYEGSSPVKAFTTLAEAEGYVAAIQAHEAVRPESPSESIDTPEGEAAFDAWWELQQAWDNAHPAKGFAHYDSFAVVQVECVGLAARSLPPTDANFCARCGKRLHEGGIHTCSLPTDAPRVREWMPVATAPKGRKVLAGYFNQLGKWRTVKACYYEPQTLPLHDDYDWDDPNSDGYASEGWYEETETHEVVMPLEVEPTHWQPLPAPPVAIDAALAQQEGGSGNG